MLSSVGFRRWSAWGNRTIADSGQAPRLRPGGNSFATPKVVGVINATPHGAVCTTTQTSPRKGRRMLVWHQSSSPSPAL
jgi:hypothetical protein